MSEPLPFELQLMIATKSPGAWFSLVRASKSLALYARYDSFLLLRLRERFSVERDGKRILPSGLKHGPCREVLALVGFPPLYGDVSYHLGVREGDFLVSGEAKLLRGRFVSGE